MGYAHILLADAGRPRRSDEYEWEYICDTTAGKLSVDELARAVDFSSIRPLQEGHAYSLEELRELRSILRMRGDRQSDSDRLQRDSDKFVFLVGWWVQGERRLSGKKRINDIRKRFLTPAQALLDTTLDTEFAKEFSQPWGGFVDFDHHKFRRDLEAVVAAASNHITAIKKDMARGKAWDHGLKRLHVYLTACFCEYFNHEFEPSRMSASGKEERRAFQEAVELLAKPLFKSVGRRGGFSGAIREHIDDWNAAKRRLFAKMATAGFSVAK